MRTPGAVLVLLATAAVGAGSAHAAHGPAQTGWSSAPSALGLAQAGRGPAHAALARAGRGPARAGWGPARPLAPRGNSATGRSNAVVAVAPRAFVAAWAWGPRGGRAAGAVQARRIRAGHVGPLLTVGRGRVSDVRLWSAPGHAAVATWSSGAAILLRRIGADGRLGSPVRVTASAAGGRGVVAVPRADGSITVAWVDRAAVVRARQISPSGRRGPVTALTETGGRADELVGAPDMDRGVLLVWSSGGTLFGQRITATGAAPRPTFQVSPTGAPAAAPQVSADGTGGATVVFERQGAIVEATVIADDKIGGVERLSAPGTTALSPALAVRGLDADVVWEARTGRRAVVAGLDADGQRATLSRPSPPGLQPDVALDAAGHGLVVWQRDRVVQAAAFGHAPTSLSARSARDTFPHIAAARRTAVAVWVRSGRVETAVHRAGDRAR